MDENEVRQLYERVAGARIPDSLIVDALDLVGHSPRMLDDRSELVDRLTDDTHARVLRKEVSDVVMLVTAALEAQSVEAYAAFVDFAEAQVPILEPFDELTGLLRRELGGRLAAHAMDEAGEGAERKRVVCNLQAALTLLGEDRNVIHLAQIWEA